MDRQTILDELKQPLDVSRIAKRKGAGSMELSYLTGHDVIASLNEIFGFDGWSDKLLSLDFVADIDKGEMWRATVELSAWIGERLIVHSDTGVGISKSKKGEEIEKTIKEAATDALKRASRKFGDQFGNCLYDKTAPEHQGNQRKPIATHEAYEEYKAARKVAIELGVRLKNGDEPPLLPDDTEAEIIADRTAKLNEQITKRRKPKTLPETKRFDAIRAATVSSQGFGQFEAALDKVGLDWSNDLHVVAFEQAASKIMKYEIKPEELNDGDWGYFASVIEDGSLRW